MTDRELLELAAKAAGIEGKWAEWDHAYGDYREQGLDYGGRTLWNPLDDDGDAFRLMVDLRLIVVQYTAGLTVHQGGPVLSSVGYGKYPDRRAAVRYAIVFAAAEIGRSVHD